MPIRHHHTQAKYDHLEGSKSIHIEIEFSSNCTCKYSVYPNHPFEEPTGTRILHHGCEFMEENKYERSASVVAEGGEAQLSRTEFIFVHAIIPSRLGRAGDPLQHKSNRRIFKLGI